MQCELLGRSGRLISEFALGTTTHGENWGWGGGDPHVLGTIRPLIDGHRP